MLRKIAAVIIENRKILLVREKDHDFFMMPGGVVEGGETDEENLRRELFEELRVIPVKSEFLGSAMSRMNDGRELKVDFCLVKYSGTPEPSSEIEDFAFINSGYKSGGVKITKTVEDFLIPKLVGMDLID